MAIKKSELYRSLWASCDELRGAMDASQYKDYVLVLLFIKYISDKYAGVPYAPITVPKGASFKDMVALKGKTTIGDDINKKIISPIAEANQISLTAMPDFDNPEKLGSGSEKVQRLGNLIAIFENPALDFSKNRAEGDDILGDAYEYLMRNFATESGKSKGQFYTPAEVSRIMAKVIGIRNEKTTAQTTIYDPTCGSGSLLLKVADEAEQQISIYGQENDNATVALANMNMILHNYPSRVIKQGNTIANPRFLDDNNRMKTFDFVVANPPFSYKAWSNGINPAEDVFDRFKDYGIPPAKKGDYAFLLHIVKSLKTKGKGAVILPHGILFRGNAEAEIRKNLIKKGYIKGIIGLPANLFYGTTIPACIVVIDKENAEHRKGIFMIDAGKGFIKDGNKNRLREQDIHKIVDVFTRQLEVPKYSRMIPLAEVSDVKNDYDLNSPRYIESQDSDDIQDIEAHLLGDIPNADVEALSNYWEVYPNLRDELFGPCKRKKYSTLKVDKSKIKYTIFHHPEFVKYGNEMNAVFAGWKNKASRSLKNLGANCKPKQVVYQIAEDILQVFSNKSLIDKYDVYQHLMNYWADTMQDDVYVLAADGWGAGKEVVRLTKKQKKDSVEKEINGIQGLEGRLIPPQLLIKVFFANGQAAIDELTAKKEEVVARMDAMQSEHSGEEGLLNEVIDEKEKISRRSVLARIKELGKVSDDNRDELNTLNAYAKLLNEVAVIDDKINDALKKLENEVIKKYPALTENEIKRVVVEEKWMTTIEKDIKAEMDQISQRLAQRIKELAERYETPLPEIVEDLETLTNKVNNQLKKMGFAKI